MHQIYAVAATVNMQCTVVSVLTCVTCVDINGGISVGPTHAWAGVLYSRAVQWTFVSRIVGGVNCDASRAVWTTTNK